MLSKSLFWVGMSALIIACNPYNPELGPEPFRCGTNDPVCPDGYRCDVRAANDRVCVPEDQIGSNGPDGGSGGSDGGGPFVCNDDGAIDDNNSLGTATLTPIPDIRPDYELINLSICPTTDRDIYEFRIDENGKNLDVRIRFLPSQGTLLLNVLNSSGNTIMSGAAVGPDPNDPSLTVVQVEINNMPADTYFAEVLAAPGVENNYAIHIVTSGP